MKQKSDDIVLVEGNNILDVAMTPVVPVYLVPCVYCGATFGTEESLIAHMESRHSGKPYLISARLPQNQMAYGNFDYVDFYAKGYVPESPSNGYYDIVSYIYSDACAALLFRSEWGGPAGFHEMSGHILSYGVVGPPAHYIYVPVGSYPVLTGCYTITLVAGEYVKGWVWKDKDTGLIVYVGEAPPPEADIFVSLVKVTPTTVYVGAPVEIMVAVSNTGTATGELTVTTTVNGIPIDTRTVTRIPGSVEAYFLTYTPEEAGDYIVEADGVTASFTAIG